MRDCLKSLKKTVEMNAVWYGIAGAAAAADLCLKHFAEKQYIEEHTEKSSNKKRKLRFREVIHNSGFAGERLREKPEIVAAVAGIFTLLLALRLPFHKSDKKKFGWALVLGGAFSNTIDRVRNRYVVDYLPHGKYVYNLGDLEIYTGAAIATAAEILEKE